MTKDKSKNVEGFLDAEDIRKLKSLKSTLLKVKNDKSLRAMHLMAMRKHEIQGTGGLKKQLGAVKRRGVKLGLQLDDELGFKEGNFSGKNS